mgnify:CR=1 FL=1
MALKQSVSLAEVEAILSHIPDPEIPVISIRELGILRDVRLDAETDAQGDASVDVTVNITITPTYGGCPAMDQIRDDIVSALAQAGLTARVSTRLAPPWTTDWISPEGREKLRAYGIAPPHAAARPQPGVIRFAPKNIATHAYSTRAKTQNDPGNEAVCCPRCNSVNTTETSHFGSTACKALYRCLDCTEPFDYFKPY